MSGAGWVHTGCDGQECFLSLVGLGAPSGDLRMFGLIVVQGFKQKCSVVR